MDTRDRVARLLFVQVFPTVADHEYRWEQEKPRLLERADAILAIFAEEREALQRDIATLNKAWHEALSERDATKAREAALREALMGCVEAIDHMAHGVRDKDAEGNILAAARAALTAHTEAGEWRGDYICNTCRFVLEVDLGKPACDLLREKHAEECAGTLVPYERRKGGA